MSRADELRALADQVEQLDQLTADYEVAVNAFRADPGNEELRETYCAARDRLQAARTASRADRDGLSVGGDAVKEG